jgi:DNA-binding response OmpR family regulator/tetratricopeptide (TPR) repeat protein
VALRILIVEDDKHIRRILESLLQHDPAMAARGVEITVAEDGKAGLEALDKLKPDLVVSDLLMPRMDGFQFCRELRKHKNGQGVPLIVTSAIYKDQQTINKLHAETGAEFFSKPFQVRELMVTVRRLLGEGGAAAHKAGAGTPAPSARTESGKLRPADPAGMITHGQLVDRGPPRLLLDLAEQRATGVVTLQRGKVRKDIALLHGTPITVSSNLRTETLGHFLVARGVIDEARHRQALERAQQGQDRLGHVLVEMAFITEQELLKQLGAQMRAKITNLLRWKEGAWSFQPGQPPTDRLQTPVEAPRMVFTGLQKTAHVDEIAQELVKVRGRVGLTLRAERHREAFVRVFGSNGIDLLQRRPLLEDVMAGADPTAMLVQLDALLVCGMAEIEPGAVEKRGPNDKTDPASLERILVDRAPVPAPAPARNLYDELFSDEISEVKPLPAPPAAQAAALGDDDQDEDSGVMHLPTGEYAAQQALEMSTVAVAQEADPIAESLRKEVLTEYLEIHGKDYYEVLHLGRDAAPEDIAAGYAEMGKRFRLERFADVDLGRDYAHLEEIHQILRQAFETLTSREQREQYDRALEAKVRPSQAALDADLLAQEATQLIARGEVARAVVLLAQAVNAAPDQADYQALLGWALFSAEGGQQKGASAAQIKKAAGVAWPHLEQALAIDPDSLDGHDYAGRIAGLAGNDEQSVTHLEKVLDTDPTRGDALTALEAAHTRRADWRRLERQYRKLIHRLGDQQDPERALRLWWRLAELYRVRLGDRSSAKVAYEIAAKLAPDDPRPRDALAKLHGEEPGDWQKTAQALRESWRIAPGDGQPGRALFKLHVEGERWDLALAAAGALAARGVEDAAATEFLKRFRTRFLQRAGAPLSSQLVDRLRHPDDDRVLSRLFAVVFAVHHPPFALADLGVSAVDGIAPETLPEPFAKVLAYLAELFGVSAPPVYRRADFGSDAHVGAMAEPVLLAGPQALALHDRIGLAFRLGRALTYLWPGRALVGALPTRHLKTILLATVTLSSPGLKIDDADGQIAALRAQLAVAPGLARDVAPLVDRLLKVQGALNLSRYTRGLARTAERVGLLVCNELQAAARITAETSVPGAVDDLLDFALSPEYHSAKEALGLSIAV